jgi:hypothetical protein
MTKLSFHRPDYPAWPAHASTMYEMLGHNPKRHLPDEGLPGRMIQGKWVWVRSRADTPRGQHRVMTECPICLRVCQAGKLFQHAKIHKEDLNDA